MKKGSARKSMRDKKRELRRKDHLTTPPRLEGKAKNAMMNPVRKKKRSQKPKGSEK